MCQYIASQQNNARRSEQSQSPAAVGALEVEWNGEDKEDCADRAYYVEAGQSLNAVAIDQHADGNCVAPSAETALGGTYEPLSRPLFIYTRESFLEDRPEVLGFVNFYLQNVPTLVPEVGYVEMPDAKLEEQFAKIEDFLP